MKKINVKLSFTGVIDIKNIKSDSVMALNECTNISSLLSILKIRKEHQKYIISIINEDKKRLDYILKDGDHISLYLPIGGG